MEARSGVQLVGIHAFSPALGLRGRAAVEPGYRRAQGAAVLPDQEPRLGHACYAHGLRWARLLHDLFDGSEGSVFQGICQVLGAPAG